MFTNTLRTAARTLAAGSLLLGSAMATPAVLADDHDDDDDRFGAYIYAGSIDAIDDATVVEDIDELERDDDDHDEGWQLLSSGQDMPEELFIGNEDLDDDLDLESLTAEPHMVVVHESDNRDSDIVAVGMIEGEMGEDGSLLIALDEYEDSGWEGRAWIGHDEDDDDDDDDSDDLDVIVGVYPAGSVEPLGTPEAIG